jgi:hypothetical protein
MQRLLALAALCGIAATQSPVAHPQSQVAVPQSELKSVSASGDIPGLPSTPRGKSTILGGQIRTIDPVRDELTLIVFGQRPLKILFDERTQVYRDGKKIPLRDLRPTAHASVQTLLDGTDVYALSIHMLSQSPDGDYQGRVLNYNSATNELTINSVMFHEPIKLVVPPDTPVIRVGQTTFTSASLGSADLVRGTLISVDFAPDGQGHGIANRISVLAKPGSAFVFVGNVTALDMHAGTLSLVDPVDDKTYQISFDFNGLPIAHTLHAGDHVMVTADFNGAHYVASAITINN